jgi:CHAT domain-containing protein
MITYRIPLIFLAMATSNLATAAEPISATDSFRVGNKGVLCTAQSRSEDDQFKSMFDRGYEIVCRDAAMPVGRLYALRLKQSSGWTSQREGVTCDAPTPVRISGIADASKSNCHETKSGLNYTVYSAKRGDRVFAAEGLTAYDSALQLGLQSVVKDQTVEGEISVATTNAGDPAALARVQAASLDPAQALAAGYAHINQGSFAEASEFFETLVSRSRGNESGALKPAEYLANQAMQQSNLGNRAQADQLFVEAERAADGSDPLFGRLYRNLRVMHRLNGRDADGALALLDQSVPAVSTNGDLRERLGQGYIDKRLAQRLAVDDEAMSRLGGGMVHLTEKERAALLDAQADYLRGVALRLKGNAPGAKAALSKSIQSFSAVRGGAVRSMVWLQASAATELSQLAEAEGDKAGAESYLQQSLTIYGSKYPESATLLAARGRLAGMQARHGKSAEAIATFRELVRSGITLPGGSEALRGLIKPYLDTLVTQAEKDPASAADFFAASQALVRPGVAQTQAVFARELSGGSSEASSLFRQSVNLSRELVSIDVEISRLATIETRKPDEEEALSTATARRKQIAIEQTGLLAQLGAFPKFRAMSNSLLQLDELQQNLREGEAYFKLILLEDSAYGVFAKRDGAKIFKIAASRAELETMTNTVRDSIVVEDVNQLVTNPFDLVTSRKLFQLMFGPVESQLPSVNHLIFEPDGPLLKLPANVLVTAQAGVDAYQARQKEDNPDAFDFSGIAWLGKDRMVSTAVSAQAFIDVRKIPASKAKRRYLGVGQNTPTEKLSYAPHSEEGRDACDWGLSLWNKPISGAELNLASTMLGGADNLVITGDGYSDTALRERTDLNNFRIIQFATHGLVTAPHPGCPARPALVTSYGPTQSDGLLSFKEIFDLRLDADTIILSACDTAGAATASATREAGISTGGNFALDGLVRAFVGAGARTVIASHWPVPDDYDATKKLMSGIYEGGTKMSVGESMRASQTRLMNDPLTSHPYYWAAFAIVGDASKPLTTN